MKTSEAITVEHRYDQPPAAIWRALTEPSLHARWWAAGDVRPVVGHRFTLDMGPWGVQPCEVLDAEPERLLRYRFATGTLDTVITWALVPDDGGTRLRLRHDGFDPDTPMGRTALAGMSAGWPTLLARLATVLDG